MPTTIYRPASQPRGVRRVTPSVVDPATAEPFTLEQELKPFGAWVGDPIWVPPKDVSKDLAQTMLHETRPFAAPEKRWQAVVKKHRGEFTQVRELDLFQASIRLPKGRFFVTVTEQKNFDKITDPIPDCVQTRLDEFLSGPGQERGVKVYYLKPLCVEMGDELILTSREDLTAAITKIQDEVFAEYRRRAPWHRTLQAVAGTANLALTLPRAVMRIAIDRKQRALDAMQARLEFERRKLALRSAHAYCKHRTSGCTFDEMLELTNPLKRTDVIDQYCTEQELSRAQCAVAAYRGRNAAVVRRDVDYVRGLYIDAGGNLSVAARAGLRPGLRRRNARRAGHAAEDRPLRRSGWRDARRDLTAS